MGAPSFELPNMMVGYYPANVDMSSDPTPGLGLSPVFQFTVVSLAAPASGVGTESGAGLVQPASGAPIFGILQDNPKLGVAGSVMVQGISKAQIGTGGCTPGTILMSDGAGKLIPATAGNDGVALALATATAGAIAPVLIRMFGKR